MKTTLPETRNSNEVFNSVFLPSCIVTMSLLATMSLLSTEDCIWKFIIMYTFPVDREFIIMCSSPGSLPPGFTPPSWVHHHALPPGFTSPRVHSPQGSLPPGFTLPSWVHHHALPPGFITTYSPQGSSPRTLTMHSPHGFSIYT